MVSLQYHAIGGIIVGAIISLIFYQNVSNGVIIFILFFIGSLFPDIDLIGASLTHRSWFSHNLMIPAIVYFVTNNPWVNFFAFGMLLHLILDVPQKGFSGTAIPNRPVLSGLGHVLMIVGWIISIYYLWIIYPLVSL